MYIRRFFQIVQFSSNWKTQKSIQYAYTMYVTKIQDVSITFRTLCTQMRGLTCNQSWSWEWVKVELLRCPLVTEGIHPCSDLTARLTSPKLTMTASQRQLELLTSWCIWLACTSPLPLGPTIKDHIFSNTTQKLSWFQIRTRGSNFSSLVKRCFYKKGLF